MDKEKYDMVRLIALHLAGEIAEEERERFSRVMTEKLDRLPGNRSALNNIFLDIYANPVKNSLSIGGKE